MRSPRGVLPGLGATLLVLGACSVPSGAILSTGTTPQAGPAAATSSPPAPATTKAPTAPGTASSAAPSPSGSPASSMVLGRRVFEETAGGVGCASCHGMDGGGKGGTPFIRGASESRVRAALGGGVPAMSFIKLPEEEILAVVDYLDYLTHLDHH